MIGGMVRIEIIFKAIQILLNYTELTFLFIICDQGYNKVI